MLIIPAIDLMDGRCVRLLRGDFETSTRYGDPAAQIKEFANAGAEWIHVVDLDGAMGGGRRQTALIAELARSAGVKIQCGGGVRLREDVVALIAAGVHRVVVGSRAARDPVEVNRWIEEFGAERICCAFDVRRKPDGGYGVAVDGWTADGGVSIEAALSAFPQGVLRHALATDISRDGALTGPNIDLLEFLMRTRPDIQAQASGGVSSLADLDALRRAGASAVIVGRALYEGRFTLEEALGR
jgi:phosphoribosylformimino-5-aminoimidazole carboxamide ribotide isomerase